MQMNQLPAVVKREIKNAKLPLNNLAAKAAIRECANVDQLKDLSDRATAMAAYAKQSGDEQMLNDAKRIILRAKSRLGELLREIPRSRALRSELSSKGKRRGQLKEGKIWVKNPDSRTGVARRLGLSLGQAGTVMRMGAVPENERDLLIERTPPASQYEIAARAETRSLFADDYRIRFGESYHLLMTARNGTHSGALARMSVFSKTHVARDLASRVGFDEAERLRIVISEVVQWLDELECHLPKSKP